MLDVLIGDKEDGWKMGQEYRGITMFKSALKKPAKG